MAPRMGWSRRAQYGLFFSFIAAVAGLVIGLIMLALSLLAPNSYRFVRGAALDATAPVTGALREVVDTASGLGSGAGNYWDAIAQNGRLKAERVKLNQRMVEAKAIAQENRQLKAALQLRERSPKAVATGRIVGSSFTSPRRFAVLSAGSRDGVLNGMPVRAPEGLVGRIVDAGMVASRVLLVSDRSNIVPARMLRTGMPVISQGRGDGTVDLRPLEVGRNPFKRGDIVVTSGTGGLYPPLVPIARVVKLDDDGAIAVPLADPARISFAMVEPAYEPAALAAEAAEPR
ncbi:rod shape-determining protein MreC [Sphingomonas sp.]|uniref:rod shape-determining protein MreC n=1 Tax=Sphingomonas sp. TaxID=28214 RepID=UPI00286E1492|nr:rod shape-determining protein MreC [Sphingomonas sp.]